MSANDPKRTLARAVSASHGEQEGGDGARPHSDPSSGVTGYTRTVEGPERPMLTCDPLFEINQVAE